MTLPEQVELDPDRDYPLAAHRPELLRTPTGKPIDDLTTLPTELVVRESCGCAEEADPPT